MSMRSVRSRLSACRQRRADRSCDRVGRHRVIQHRLAGHAEALRQPPVERLADDQLGLWSQLARAVGGGEIEQRHARVDRGPHRGNRLGAGDCAVHAADAASAEAQRADAPRRPNGRVSMIGLPCRVSRRRLGQLAKNAGPRKTFFLIRGGMISAAASRCQASLPDPLKSVAIRRARGQDGRRKTSFLPDGVTTRSRRARRAATLESTG